MGSYSIQLNTLSAPGGAPLDLQEIHRERAESALSKYLLKDGAIRAFFDQMGSETNFNFTIGQRGVKIVPEGERGRFFEMEPGPLKELKKLARIPQFYSHIGAVKEKPVDVEEEAVRKKAAKVAVNAMVKSSIPGAKGNAMTVTAIGENGLTLTRNILQSLPMIGPGHVVPHNLAYGAGSLWAVFGAREVWEGRKDYIHAKQIGDHEGKNRAVGRLTTGTLGTVGAGFYLAGKIAISKSAPVMTAASLSFVADWLFGIGSIVGIGLSSLGAHRCSTFRKRVNEYYENKELSKEQQVRGTLNYLRKLLLVSKDEQRKLIREINEEHPEMDLEEKQALFKQRLADKTEVNVKYLKRRTSNKSLELILNRAEPLLANLNDPAALEEADELIKTVLWENRVKWGLYLVGLIFSIVSLVGVILADFFSLGAVPFIVMGVASGVFLSITLYNFAVQLWYKKESDSGDLMGPLDAPASGM